MCENVGNPTNFHYHGEPQSSLAKKIDRKEQLTLFSYVFWVPSDLGSLATRWQSCAGKNDIKPRDDKKCQETRGKYEGIKQKVKFRYLFRTA